MINILHLISLIIVIVHLDGKIKKLKIINKVQMKRLIGDL